MHLCQLSQRIRLPGSLLVSLALHLVLLGSIGCHAGLGWTQRPSTPAVEARLVGRTGSRQSTPAYTLSAQHDELPPREETRHESGTEVTADERSEAAPPIETFIDSDKTESESIVCSSMDCDGSAKGQPFFYPSRVLNRSPVPISAPDPRKYLAGIDIPPIPFRVRLLIDASGTVVSVESDFASSPIEPHISAIQRMFLATTFIPGNLAGRDVPSYMDIELELTDL